MKLRKTYRLFIAVILVLSLAMGAPFVALAGPDDVLGEVRSLLENQYVEVVSNDVLEAETVEDMLEKLGDRHTQYLSKEDYDFFLDTLDRSFSGIGIELEMVAQGVLVTKVFEGYGAAKAGIIPGDIIIDAGGDSLAEKTSEFSVSRLRGTAGSKVAVKVKRDNQTLDLTIERMTIELPLIHSEVLENHIGYVLIYSFGLETATQFDKHVRALKEKGVDSWIVDLRNNGGGYTQMALDLLGYIIGEKNAVVLKDRSILSIVYNATKQAYTLETTEQPIILLTNGYTGSSSEIVTAAVKDHNKATIIGETTYGSGRVKALMPLSNGDYLKMTINKFFSPYNSAIDEIGIKPHMNLTGVDELQTAVLMLKDYSSAQEDNVNKAGYLQLNAGPNNFAIPLEDMREVKNWALGMKILDSAYVTTTLRTGTSAGWEAFHEVYLQDRSRIYYPDYVRAGDLPAIPLNKKFTVTYNKAIDWKSTTSDSVELIDTATGERIKSRLDFTSDRIMTVTPDTELKPATEYWLVLHPTIQDVDGANVTGGVAVAKTVK